MINTKFAMGQFGVCIRGITNGAVHVLCTLNGTANFAHAAILFCVLARGTGSGSRRLSGIENDYK